MLETHPTEHILRPDSKGRIALGALAKGVSSFHVFVDSQQRIVLEPFAEIPAREKWLFENKKALAAVERGLKESRNKKTKSLGSFARYAKDKV